MTSPICFVCAAAFLGALIGLAPVAAATGDEPTPSLRLEYGTTLALSGDLEAAERVFTALIVPGPEGAAAWCNLGNVYLMRGDAAVARDFYDRALESKPGAPGVLLNRAIARALLADVAGSRADAANAVGECGGFDEALALLGIASSEPRPPADEMEHVSFLSEEDVRALLGEALSQVPAGSAPESTSSAAGDSLEDREAPQPVWRPAGTRASGGTETARVLHWPE